MAEVSNGALYVLMYCYVTYKLAVWRLQTLHPLRIVEDFRDWTNWLFYRGGIGVKGEESWEAWWEEELVIEFVLFSLAF